MDEQPPGSALRFVAPTVADLRAAILRVARGDEAVWVAVCGRARDLPWSGTDDDVRDRLVQAAKAQGGAVTVVALSFEVRLNSYRNLSALNAARTS